MPCAWIAVIATVLTMSSTSAPRDRSLTGFFRPCKHRADGDRAGASLDRLIGVVAGVEVREDQHGGAACDFGVGHLRLGHGRLHRRVVLNGPVDEQVRIPLAHQLRCRPDLVDVGAGAARAGRVGQHGHPRLDTEPGRGARRRDRDVGQLFGRRVRHDRAVPVGQHPVGQAHQEDARHRRHVRQCLDDLERGPDGVRRGVPRTRHHAVHHVVVHQHRPEVGDVVDDLAGLLDRHALVFA